MWTLWVSAGSPKVRYMVTNIDADHPGVKSSHCQGAIGILTVKKTVNGVHLYFGHNTDSFVSTFESVHSYSDIYRHWLL